MKNLSIYKKGLIPILFIFQSCFLFANFNTTDSLLHNLSEINDNHVKMHTYAKLSRSMRYRNTKQSIIYIQNAIELANKIGTEKEKLKYQYQYQLSVMQCINGEYDKSIKLCNSLLENPSIIEDSTFIGIHNALSFSYQGLGELHLAIKYGKKAIQLSQSLKLSTLSIPSIGCLAKINMDNGNYEEALSYFFQAKKEANLNNRYIQKAWIFKDLAELYFYQDEYDLGIKAAQKSISISQKFNLYIIENDALINLSRLYAATNQLDKALVTVDSALKNLEGKKNIHLILRAQNAKATILSNLGQIDKAIELSLLTIRDAQYHNAQKQIIEFHDYTAKLYGKKEDFKNAFFYQNKAKQLRTSLLQTEKIKIIKLAESKAGIESKNIKEQILKTSYYSRITNTLGYSMAITLWIGLLLILIIRRFDNVSSKFKNVIPLFHQSTNLQEFEIAKNISTWSVFFLLLLICHFYYWNLHGAMFTTTLLLLMFILIFFFAKKENIAGVFYASMIPYFVFAITPIFLGNLSSIPICIVATFLVNCFLIPKKTFQIVNVSLACISSISYLYYQTIAKAEAVKIPFATELDLLITLIGILFIIGNVLFYYKNLNKLKRQVLENNDFMNQISDINPHFIFTKNKNREYTFVNEALAKVYQFEKTQLIGKKHEDLDDYFITHTNSQEDDLAILNQEVSCIKKEEFFNTNGKKIWLETTKKPILDKHNNVIGIYGFADNITAKKETERNIIERNKEYCGIFSHSFDSLIITDVDGQIIDSDENALTFFGYKNKQSICQDSIWKLFPQKQEQMNLDEFLNSRITICNAMQDAAFITNGEIISVENSLIKMEVENQTQIIWATKDVSKKIQLKEKEKELHQQKLELQKINNELVSQTISEKHINSFLQELEDNLKKIIPLVDGKGKQDLDKLVRKIGAEQQSEDNFYEFKLKFEKSHPNFFDKLFEINPKLTQTDLKISAYIKLGMTPRDIANILSIEKKSVEMAKYRLKKKINLLKEEDLNIFIHQL